MEVITSKKEACSKLLNEIVSIVKEGHKNLTTAKAELDAMVSKINESDLTRNGVELDGDFKIRLRGSATWEGPGQGRAKLLSKSKAILDEKTISDH